MFTKAHIRPLNGGHDEVLIRSLSSELQPVNQTGGPAPKQNVNNVCLQSNRKITFLEEIICYNTNLNDLMC